MTDAEGSPAPKIVAIDDSLGDRNLLRTALERRAHVEVVVVSNGKVGLDLARAYLNHGLAAVVVDLHLPDVDGLEVLHDLKTDPATAPVPVVVLTADSTPGLEAFVLAEGAAAFVLKPADLDDLADRVLDACGLA